jgi:hypothetical protein
LSVSAADNPKLGSAWLGEYKQNGMGRDLLHEKLEWIREDQLFGR